MARPPSSTSDVLLYFIAIFVPPLPVFIKVGCGANFWINILLWILGWIPGVIHAWWVISKNESVASSYATPARTGHVGTGPVYAAPHSGTYAGNPPPPAQYAAPAQPPRKY